MTLSNLPCTQSPLRRVVRGSLYTPLAEGGWSYEPDGLLAIDEANTIAWVEPCTEERLTECSAQGTAVETLDKDALLLPGLVDAHTHLPQWGVRGVVSPSLLDWLQDHIWPEEARFHDLAYTRQVSQRFFRALKAQGTLTAGLWLPPVIEAVDVIFEEALAAGVRVVGGLNLMDCNGPAPLVSDTNRLLNATDTLISRWHGKQSDAIRYALMPRFALNVSRPLMAGLAERLQTWPDLCLHTHLSEQQAECKAVAEAFPEARDYVDVYDQAGLVGPSSVFAHSVHLSQRERQRLSQAGATVVHCPSANFFLKSGRFDWQAIESARVPIALGSDVGAGPELSMWRVMRDAQFTQESHILSPHALLRAATLVGAQALGVDQRVGSLEVGKQAEFNVVKPLDPDLWQKSLAIEEQLNQLIFMPDSFAKQCFSFA